MTTDVAEPTTIDTAAELASFAEPPADNAPPVGDAEPAPNADAAAADTKPDASKQDEPPAYEDGKAYVEAKRKERKGGKPEAEQQQSRVDPNAVAEKLQTYQKNLDARYKAIDELDIDQYNLMTEAGVKKLKDDLKQHVNSTHADAQQYAGYEAAQHASLQVVESVQQGLAEALTADGVKAVQEQMQALAAEGKPVTWADYHRLTKEQVITEYRDSKEYADEMAQSFDDGRAMGERTADSARSSKTPTGASAVVRDPNKLPQREDGTVDTEAALAHIANTPPGR